ncbi:hypothetical protein cand_003900 [Cryptosporidium andersoni]|uniref:Uncharacterized protein n=1 Tax=Cryptosporidium andersoni TaxID=117008 RepID=A0A1J4MQ41_9CRYT|nr:hypothetical protein cand_003900 [Cryptosporidium andersoni]
MSGELAKRCCRIISQVKSILDKQTEPLFEDYQVFRSDLFKKNYIEYIKNDNIIDDKPIKNNYLLDKEPISKDLNLKDIEDRHYEKEVNLIWIGNNQKENPKINEISNNDIEYIHIDSYTSTFIKDKSDICYISLQKKLPSDSIVGIKIGPHICKASISDNIIEFIIPLLSIGYHYIEIFINGVRIPIRIGDDDISDLKDKIPINIKPAKFIRNKNLIANKVTIPSGVMGRAPLPEIDIDEEVEELVRSHKPRISASIIAKKRILRKYLNNTYSKVVNQPRSDIGDLRGLDPSFKAAVCRDFRRKLIDKTLTPKYNHVNNIIEDFLSRLDFGISNAIIPFHKKLDLWNISVKDKCDVIIDQYHQQIFNEASNEKSVYIFTKRMNSLEPYNIFVFSCISNNQITCTIPTLRRFICNVQECNDGRLWTYIGECVLCKNKIAQTIEQISLPCPIPCIMKSDICNNLTETGIQIASNVYIYYESWPNKLLPVSNVHDMYCIAICINSHIFYTTRGVTGQVLSFIISWLKHVPTKFE